MFRDEIFMPSGQGCFLFIDGGLLWRNFTSKVKVRFSCKHGNDDYSIHLTDRYIVFQPGISSVKPKVLNYIYMYEDIDILFKFLKVIDKVWFFFFFFSSLEGILCIDITWITGMMKESDKNSGKTYAVFAVRATKISGDEEEVSDTYRRYSDFHDLHMLIQEKVGQFLTDSEKAII